MENLARFHCKIVECEHASTNVNRYLNHTWDKQSLNKEFSYKCDVSDCTSQYKNVQSFRRLKAKHYWFYEKYVKRYGNHWNRDRENDLDENFDNENVFNDNDIEQFGHKYEGQDPDHIDNISFADFDHNQLTAFFFLRTAQKIWYNYWGFMFCQWKSITYFTVEK